MSIVGDSPIPNIAVILAGGLGMRLRLLLPDAPKVLAHAAGRPFLDYLLTHLANQGVKRVILCVGYLASQVQGFAGDGERWGLEINYSAEEQPLGTGGALRRAASGLVEPFFAMNGDTLFQVSLEKLWHAHKAIMGAATLALRAVKIEGADWQARGCVFLGRDGKILSFEEKPAGSEAPEIENDTLLTSAGLYVMEPSILDGIPPGMTVSLEQQIFPRLAADSRLAGYVMQGYFADIGTPEALAAFERDVHSGMI